MNQTSDRAHLRSMIGKVGVWLGATAVRSDPGGVAHYVESLGYETLWIGGGNPDEAALSRLEAMLDATKRITISTGIASIWAWEPAVLDRHAARFIEAYGDRFLLGLGVSHEHLVQHIGQTYERPLHKMIEFLDGLDRASEDRKKKKQTAPVVPRVLAALAPRMLKLSGERAEGCHPYLTTPTHTAGARQQLGPDPIIAPEQAFVLDNDSATARRAAATYLERYLTLPNYLQNFENLGYSAEETKSPPSDRFMDDIVVHGSPEEIVGGVRAHLASGADHVCIQPIAADGSNDPGALATLAPLLLGTAP